MNTSTVIRAGKLNIAPIQAISIKVRALGAWRRFTHHLFAEQVVGNPLHEAWTDGSEPRERMTPSELAKSSSTRYLVVPHSRGR